MDLRIARNCADLCSQAYDESDKRFVNVGEHRFGVILLEGAYYLVFRGTANAAEWCHDFEAVPERTRGGYLAHEGFISALDDLWTAVREEVKGLAPLIVTGHSLGGAMAVLCGEFQSPVYTFGCPRVYSRVNAEYPAMEHHRFVNQGDPVPDVPGPVLWQHLCDPVRLGPDNLLNAKYHDIDLDQANLAAI